jgi:hypothetical protein
MESPYLAFSGQDRVIRISSIMFVARTTADVKYKIARAKLMVGPRKDLWKRRRKMDKKARVDTTDGFK